MDRADHVHDAIPGPRHLRRGRARYHPDRVVHARLLSREPYLGHAGLREWQRDMYDAFGRFQIEWDELSSAPSA
jgi:hypothetical protein